MPRVLSVAVLASVGLGLACSSAPEKNQGTTTAARAGGDAAAGAGAAAGGEPGAGGGPATAGSGDQQAPVPDAAPAVVLESPGRSPVRVTVELARTDEERRRGLMYRQNLAPRAGMLFLFSEDEIHSFWMKNTLIPLDMIFIRNDGTVAGVVENAEPHTLDSRSCGKVSRHVLEVNGGFAREHGIGEGTRVRYENLDLKGFED